MKVDIVIIDDDVKISKMLVRRLNKINYTTLVFHQGGEAIQYVLANNPSLVILDIHMPGMDGYEVIKTLRNASYTGIVAACSASVTARDTQKTIEEGCNLFISKPIGIDFESIISNLINSI